jgi:hypothetical protein
MARYLTDLVDVLRAAGLKVVEIPGWKTRGRPGSFAPTRVLAHHTGGKSDSRAYVDWMATDGRSDLKPPLAQLALDRSGTWFVMAAGRANHAGQCKPIDGLKTYGDGRNYGDGNAQMVGVEAMNTGSEGWAPPQYDSYVRGVSALTKHYGWRPPLGHRETSLSGKPDPGRMDLDDFRRDVKADNPTPQEDDVQLSDKVRVADPKNPGKFIDVTVGAILARASWTYHEAVGSKAERAADRVADKAANDAIVAALGGAAVDIDAIREAARAGAEAGVKELLTAQVQADVDVTLTPKENLS